MTVLDRLATSLGQRSEAPNQELARDLVKRNDSAGIRELAENLWNKDSQIASDCIKTLYEVGYLQPELIAPYAGDFLKLIKSRENRLVWGGMLALSTIAALKPADIFAQVEVVKKITKEGSVITTDNGIKTLSIVAGCKEEYNRVIFPFLMEHLKTCRSKEIPQHAESTLAAVNPINKQLFIGTLTQRMDALTAPQQARVRKVIRAAEGKQVS
jgi:hypothetical protein